MEAFEMAKVLVNCTHAKEDPERAILSFVVGNVSATADQETKVLLTIDGVWLATKGYAEGVQQEGLPPLKDTLESFVKNGGEIWACGACTGPRGITADDLIPGAKIVTAANAVEYMVAGASSISF
jgi:predicted peroxiredoxin